MTKRELKIVFMGTPDFAVPSMEILLDNGYKVVGVITAPDRAAGRGKKIKMSAVKMAALKHDIKVLQPTNLKNEDFLSELKSLEANLFCIVAFRMLPKAVWEMPEYGSFNLHGSLLPKYRGAAPINWAVINGDKKTGCTTFFLQHAIDTGDLVFQEELPIGENDTAGIVHDAMMIKGASLVLKTVQAVETDTVVLKDQSDAEATHAPKIFRPDCKLDWNDSALKLHNKIRGLSPYPGAWTTLDGKTFKIFKTLKTNRKTNGELGSFYKEEERLFVNCGSGEIELLELQMEGKKRISAAEFSRALGSIKEMQFKD